MNKRIDNRSRSLSKRIFLYLTAASLFSLVIIGSFWIGDKIGIYAKEIHALKISYALTKKEEIKNRILQIKDHIYWVKDNPLNTVSSEMNIQLRNFLSTSRPGNDSVRKQSPCNSDTSLSEISFFVLDKKGKITCMHHADIVPAGNIFLVRSLFNRFLGWKKTKTSGVIPQYSKSGSADSSLNKIIYFNAELIPDQYIISIIEHKDINRMLQKYILDSLSKIRFLKDEYFFVNTYEGKALVSNGRVNMPPIDIYKAKDSAWLRIFKVQKLSKLEPGGLFYTYRWPKISVHKTTLKTSFFSYLPEWRWIMGTGFYEDDVNDLIRARRKLLISELRESALKGIALFLISVILSYVTILFLSHRLKENLKLFANFFQKAAHESDYIDASLVHYKEFRALAAYANRMVEEQRSTRKALDKSEEKFNKAFQNSPDALTITSLNNGLIIEANKVTSRITGYSYNEIIGHSSLELNYWKNIEDRTRFIKLLNEKGRIENFEADLRMKSGMIRNGLFSAEVIIIDDEKYVLSVIRDVTERKLMEASLKARENLLSLIYGHVQDAIFLVGVESDISFRFLSINRSFLDLTGLKEEQIVNRLVNEIIPEPSLSFVTKNYRQAIDEKRTVQWEETSPYPAGIKTGMVTITPLFDSDGNCMNLVGTVHDITERKKAEEEIHKLNMHLEERIAERTAQLSSINKELESFSYSISHDLRAPLRAITGFSQILARRHRSSLDEEGRQYMDYIVEASARMEQLINDLLNYSRLGRKSILIHPVSLKHIVNLIHNDFKQRLDNIGAAFIVETDLPEVPGDESLMQQILSNLVDNAIKYRSHDVLLEIKIACKNNHHCYHITVSDNGIGIAEEYFEKIFNIFQRLHSEEQYPGTGIGLATVKKAVSQLNGTIEVTSTLGKGSTFSVIIPE